MSYKTRHNFVKKKLILFTITDFKPNNIKYDKKKTPQRDMSLFFYRN